MAARPVNAQHGDASFTLLHLHQRDDGALWHRWQINAGSRLRERALPYCMTILGACRGPPAPRWAETFSHTRAALAPKDWALGASGRATTPARPLAGVSMI